MYVTTLFHVSCCIFNSLLSVITSTTTFQTSGFAHAVSLIWNAHPFSASNADSYFKTVLHSFITRDRNLIKLV